MDDDLKDERRLYANEKVLLYSSNVLIGNWYNNRFQGPVHNGSTILPGLTTETGCEQHQTCSQASYTPFNYNQSVHDHLVLRNRMYGNKVSQSAGLKLSDEDQYKNNYTTMNTLMFHLFPKMRLEECLKMEEAGQSHFTPTRPDSLDSYGNCSLVRSNKLRCKLANERPPRGLTSYRGEFDAKTRTKTENVKIGEWTVADEATRKRERDRFIFLNCNIHDDLKD
ncbi:uncharacterized protein LOC128260261 [Drosophila gunungcola]|uniref:uncharacterized protein LOC128260261 n=1 Tax=Drosophila gunungcola TaxID=103775 RepID=UPI0022E49375|nr:uncharacterized protein LOC128260261 [Drosophila gunungcola]